MSYLAISQISSILFFSILFVSAHAAVFEIRNDCSYTVWAAASPGGGRRLNPSQSWTINVPAGTSMARIWGRTNCNFDGSGRGRCQTGDCGGLLQCKGWGAPPNTLAEYALNQFGNMDFYDISLVDGFNIPMVFGPTSGGCREPAVQRVSRGFSSNGALMRTVILRMILRAPLLAVVVPITGLCFAPEASLICRWSEARAKKSEGLLRALE
ncbi:putative Elicitor-responsive protein [Hibiscus syriacus]|uniref:Elicitor-responsive protein n=1 Tax=Hibiscus syriacus TaxID=106335 RepID=A0A6A2XXC6_HIBSY|nr:putative Elicitor-responsive protein [Hibiscus syriacus]